MVKTETCRAAATASCQPVPAILPGEARAEVTSYGWVLKNFWLEVRVDGQTGCLDIVEQSTGITTIREIWPELGPPYPGGFKKPATRPLRLVALRAVGAQAEIVLESPANIWWWRDETNLKRQWPAGSVLSCYTLRRRYLLGSDRLLAVETQVIAQHFNHAKTATETMAYQGFHLRTFPWAVNRLLDVTVPLKSGLFQAPVIYEKFPFMVHDYEFLRSGDLPADPGDYQAPWSVFTSEGQAVGLIWPGASEVRFGLHWMPSVFYALPVVLAPEEKHSFPAYYFYCGSGDYRAVADYEQALSARGRNPGTSDATTVDQYTGNGIGNGWTPVRCKCPPVLAVAGKPAGIKLRLLTAGTRLTTGQVALSVPAAFTGRQPEPQEKTLKSFMSWGSVSGSTTAPPAPPAHREVLLKKEVAVSGSQPAVIKYSLDCNGKPGFQQLSLIWRAGEHETRWPVPAFILGQSDQAVQVKQQQKKWQVYNGYLQFTLAPDFDGSLTQLQVSKKRWLYTGYPKQHSIGHAPHSTGGAKFFVMPDSRDWLATLSNEDVPWHYQASPAKITDRELPWQGVVLESGAGSDKWQNIAVQIQYLTLPGSPVVLALAGYHNKGDQTVVFDSVFNLYTRSGPKQSFYYCREDKMMELPHDFKHALAVGASFGAVTAEEGVLALVNALPGGHIRGRFHKEKGLWQMTALQRVSLRAGARQQVAVYLVTAADKAVAWNYRFLTGNEVY